MTTPAWSTEPEENAAIDALHTMLAELADLLHGCADARYGDPSGGYRVG
ncbi:hypothetical protein BJY24_000203 [Nocardia transvalensis]|uniref:Uncharacterized protein n=1 Tax=Nocardia transvalensis TaxID=37333 RepID=A0A7W9P8A2_9NOCA|nr:hypothetical protein [Nocardia transvalensis]MBB5911336.1 hypothetical protein [Nocardia transvalensis]